jgi:hypothetical protein
LEPSEIRFSPIEQSPGLKVDFEVQNKNLTIGGTTTVDLKIRVFDEATQVILLNTEKEALKPVDIFSRIYFRETKIPQTQIDTSKTQPQLFKFLHARPAVQVDSYQHNISNAVKPTIIRQTIQPKSLPLIIKVESKMGISEQISEFWKVWGPLLTFLGGGFITGVTTLLFDRIRKTKKKKDRRIDGYYTDR